MPAADRPKRDPKKPQFFPVEPPPSKSNGGSWAASKIFTKSSGLINADLQSFLLTCITGWDAYSVDEQRDIIQTLPIDRRFFVTNSETGKLTCPIDVDFVAADPHLKRAISRFKIDLENGYYTQTWQRNARQAMKERTEGRFDEYLKHHIDDTFGDCQDGSGASREQSMDTAVEGQVKAVAANPYESRSSDEEWTPPAAGSQPSNPHKQEIISMQVDDSNHPNHSRPSGSRTTTLEPQLEQPPTT